MVLPRVNWLVIATLFVFLTLSQSACAPLDRPLDVAECSSYRSQQQLLSGSWLQQPAIWRLQQSALLEVAGRKFPLQGFLQLDTARREARLVAMNELGLVLFDLQLDAQSQQLHRAIPQLSNQPGFEVGVASSLRQIFLQPAPLTTDRLQPRPTTQRLWRLLPGGSLGFIYSCSGELQETRQRAAAGDWRVRYLDYQPFADRSLPQQIIFEDYRHRVKLSLWLREVKRENE